MENQDDLLRDPILQALIAEAAGDPDVIGLVLTGSRAIGAVAPDSDYDVMFVVTDAAFSRYEQTGTAPERGQALQSGGIHMDVWNEAPRNLRLDTIDFWEIPSMMESRVIYDPGGETAVLVEALRRMPAERAKAAILEWHDGYFNGLYRSLKSWRRGNILGARLEAAQSIDYLLTVLFALECRWKPYGDRLIHHLPELEPQGWQPGELQEYLLEILSTASPLRQQGLARRVIPLLHERGYAHLYAGWDGQIDQILTWEF